MSIVKEEKDRNMKEKVNLKSKTTRLKEMKKSSKGITLIALVITIIVLLILAGVTIATLTGDNGILTKATEAKEKNEIGKEKEEISVAYSGALAEKEGQGPVTAGDLNSQFNTNRTNAIADGENPITVTFTDTGNMYRVDSTGKIGEAEKSDIIASLKIVGEKATEEPPLPSSDFIHTEGTVDTGYVIQDSKGNEFVWVPVDKNQKIHINVTSKTGNIESINLKDPSGDEIPLPNIDKLEASYSNEEIEPTINGLYVLTVKAGGKTKIVTLGVHSLYALDAFNDWYATEEARAKGFGSIEEMIKGDLEEIEKNIIEQGYNSLEEWLNTEEGQQFLEEMEVSTVEEYLILLRLNNNAVGGTLVRDYTETEDYAKSINENGGFYIGRYEASYENGNAVSKVSIIANKNDKLENGKIWNNISYMDALSKAQNIYTSSEFTSSLLTGSAWDRTLGWLYETGAKTGFEILEDSSNWGNFNDDDFTTTELINTGEYAQTEANHIYDLAGNVHEWTTETLIPYTDNRINRGGWYYTSGSIRAANDRVRSYMTSGVSEFGFRLALYL